MNFESGQIRNVCPAECRPKKRSGMFPERPVHGEDSFSQERESRISTHWLNAKIFEVGSSDCHQIGLVNSTESRRALHHRCKSVAILLIAAVPTEQKLSIFGVLGAITKQVRSKDWILMWVAWRRLATVLFFQPPSGEEGA